MRFAIRIDMIWQPFMLFLGATRGNCYLELHGGELQLRFGPAFNHTISRDNVIGASPGSWSFMNGMGVIAGGSTLGLVGSTGGIVELELRDSVHLRFVGWARGVRRIAISLEDPQGFIDAVTSAGPSPEPTRPTPQ